MEQFLNFSIRDILNWAWLTGVGPHPCLLLGALYLLILIGAYKNR